MDSGLATEKIEEEENDGLMIDREGKGARDRWVCYRARHAASLSTALPFSQVTICLCQAWTVQASIDWHVCTWSIGCSVISCTQM